jgi:hypothetical protein
MAQKNARKVWALSLRLYVVLAKADSRIMENIEHNELLTDSTRRLLQDVRGSLLLLHKAILDIERNGYERQFGRVAPGELVNLLIHDPWFGWFRPVSEMVVQIDVLLDSEDPVSERDARGLLEQVRWLLRPTEEGEEFSTRYHETLQKDPDTILAHASVLKLLPPLR